MQQTDMFEVPVVYPHAPGFAKKSRTSRKAAETVWKPGKMQAMVLDALRTNGDMTDYEICDYLNLPMNRVQPRRSELCDPKINKVVASGITRATPYGKQAEVWHAK